MLTFPNQSTNFHFIICFLLIFQWKMVSQGLTLNSEGLTLNNLAIWREFMYEILGKTQSVLANERSAGFLFSLQAREGSQCNFGQPAARRVQNCSSSQVFLQSKERQLQLTERAGTAHSGRVNKLFVRFFSQSPVSFLLWRRQNHGCRNFVRNSSRPLSQRCKNTTQPFHFYNCFVKKSKAHDDMNLDFVPCKKKNQACSKNRMIRLKPNN